MSVKKTVGTAIYITVQTTGVLDLTVAGAYYPNMITFYLMEVDLFRIPERRSYIAFLKNMVSCNLLMPTRVTIDGPTFLDVSVTNNLNVISGYEIINVDVIRTTSLTV